MTCQLLKCQGARHLRPSLGDGLDVGRVVSGSSAPGGVPVGLEGLGFFYDAARFCLDGDRVSGGFLFSFAPGIVAFLVNQVGALAGQVSLDCISFSEIWDSRSTARARRS